jgi:hypothetical protein
VNFNGCNADTRLGGGKGQVQLKNSEAGCRMGWGPSMVRHSGFLTSIAAVFLAAISVSVLEQRSDGSSKNRREASGGTAFQAAGSDCFLGQPMGRDEDLAQSAIIPPRMTIQFRVPENSLVVVGSLDVSGGAHSLSISSAADGGEIAGGTKSSPSFGDLKYMDLASLSALRTRFLHQPPCQLDGSMSEISQTTDLPIVAHSLDHVATRTFLIPHFESDQVIQQSSEASLVAEGSRVQIYVDHCGINGNVCLSRQHLMHEEARRVCSIVEGELLPLIERWIGRISDLDGDHRLSVVLTDLDRRESPVDSPILGCVRRSDFAAEEQNSLTGDIVYLDRNLPSRDQLYALLAHELTHAAIYCIRHEAPIGSPLKDHSVPSWLNEAAAHWVERQFCCTPSGYEIRKAAFRQRPALCPIMLKDDDHNQPARRSGSRVAGFTFLQQHLTDVSDLRELLEHGTPFEQSIASVTEAPFSQLFRQWSILQAVGDQEEYLPFASTVSCCSLAKMDSEPVRRKLHGTAFLTLYSDVDQLVSIDAHGDARLQITVLQELKTSRTQHSSDNSSGASLQTADLAGCPERRIR